MKTLVMTLAFLLILVAEMLANCTTNASCPIHRYSSSFFTGQTTVIDGVLLAVWKDTSYNHTFLVRCE